MGQYKVSNGTPVTDRQSDRRPSSFLKSLAFMRLFYP
jgi:hypothetical protein